MIIWIVTSLAKWQLIQSSMNHTSRVWLSEWYMWKITIFIQRWMCYPKQVITSLTVYRPGRTFNDELFKWGETIVTQRWAFCQARWQVDPKQYFKEYSDDPYAQTRWHQLDKICISYSFWNEHFCPSKVTRTKWQILYLKTYFWKVSWKITFILHTLETYFSRFVLDASSGRGWT